jgi:hypothetical protein
MVINRTHRVTMKRFPAGDILNGWLRTWR